MGHAGVSLTAVFLKSAQGYVGFLEELPGVTIEGRTLDEARENLRAHATLVFDEERAQCEEMIRDRDVVREAFRLD
jgi:predicted RNase H-like HicB family nuclease